MIYLYISLIAVAGIGGVYLYIKSLQKTIAKQKVVIQEKEVAIYNLSNKIVVLAENEKNLKARESELVSTIQKLEGAKTDEEKDSVVTDSIGNFFKRK